MKEAPTKFHLEQVIRVWVTNGESNVDLRRFSVCAESGEFL